MSQAKTSCEELSTREQIIHVAIHLFANQGYDGTSVRDICEAAEVSKPVVYYYFKNKEDLFSNLLKDVYDFFLTELRQAIEGDGDFMDRLRKVTHIYFDSLSEHEDPIRLIYHTAFGPQGKLPEIDIIAFENQHLSLLSDFFSEGIELGFIRQGDVMAIVMHFLGSVSIHLQSFLLRSESLPETVEEIVIEHVLSGIGVQQA